MECEKFIDKSCGVWVWESSDEISSGESIASAGSGEIGEMVFVGGETVKYVDLSFCMKDHIELCVVFKEQS